MGRLVFAETDDAGGPSITTLEAPGDCTGNGNCAVGIRVPTGYRGHATIVFGRTRIPGESVAGDAPVLTEQEQGQLDDLVGRPVSAVRVLLADREQTASYRVGADSVTAPESEVPGDWRVTEVAPLAGGVVLWVSPR